jgi:hypothetical protein
MYTVQKTFTSKHKHNYVAGHKISNFLYLLLAQEDRLNFVKDVENNVGFDQDDTEPFIVSSPLAPMINPFVAALVAEEILDLGQTQTFVDDTPNIVADEPAFGGGTGGGAGAGGSWADTPTPDFTPDPEPTLDPDPVYEDSGNNYTDSSDSYSDNDGN